MQTPSTLLFHRHDARAVFRVAERRILLAVLATLPPGPSWDDTVVTMATLDEERVEVGVRGSAAQAVCEALALAFHRLGIPAEAGPGATEHDDVARADHEQWREA